VELPENVKLSAKTEKGKNKGQENNSSVPPVKKLKKNMARMKLYGRSMSKGDRFQ
jgi:hypothetical protein